MNNLANTLTIINKVLEESLYPTDQQSYSLLEHNSISDLLSQLILLEFVVELINDLLPLFS